MVRQGAPYEVIMKFRHLLTICLYLLGAASANAARDPVLKQIQLPHNYYYREIYLPQLTTGRCR